MEEVRRRLHELKRRTGVADGDEFDVILNTVEALAATMVAMSNNASALVKEGQRNVGSIVSAALTRGALWRLYVLPAIVGGAFASMVMTWSNATAISACGSQRESDRVAMKVQSDELGRRYDNDQQFLNQQLQALEAERRRINSTLPGELIERADHLTGVARNLVQLEAANPGMLDWIAHFGANAKKITDLNGSLCPHTYYAGATMLCAYESP